MTESVRNLISRGTLLVIAVALIYSGVFCIGKAKDICHDEVRRREAMPNPRARMNGGFVLIGGVGAILCGGGLVAAFGGLASRSLIERVLGRPTNTTLHERPDPWPGEVD